MTSQPPELPPPTSDTPEPTDPATPEAAGDETLRAQHLDLDALSAYLDGALEPGEMAAARAHLATCPECGEDLAELRATVALLQGLPQYAPRRTFQLGPEHARGATRAPARVTRGVEGWFERLLPWFPTLRIATVAVAVLLVAVIAGDLVTNRGSEMAGPGQSRGIMADATTSEAEMPAPAPAMEAPPVADEDAELAREAAPRSAAYQPTMSTFAESEPLATGESITFGARDAFSGTESTAPASMEMDEAEEDASGIVVSPAAPATTAPEEVSDPAAGPSGWRLAQVGLGLALVWLIVSLVGLNRIRGDRQ